MFNTIIQQMNELAKAVECFSIGKSGGGKDIWCFKLGCGGKTILIQCAIHAREHITTFFALEHIKYLKNFYIGGTIYYIPCMNPDGVQLCLDGAGTLPANKRRKLTKINKGTDFTLYKANINGVDLNTNFDADWGRGKFNITTPASENFVGNYPHSESEVKALVNFTKEVMPDITLSYHSKGEVIYYGFNKPLSVLEKRYLKIIKELTGYKSVKTKNSTGGYKDYCISKLNIPSYTIEVGNDHFKHPVPMSELEVIFEQNRLVPLKLMKQLASNK